MHAIKTELIKLYRYCVVYKLNHIAIDTNGNARCRQLYAGNLDGVLIELLRCIDKVVNESK